jgi:hypothetical protein
VEPAARRPPVLEGAGRAAATAAGGGAFAVLWLTLVCLLASVILSFVVGVYGIRTWAKIGLLTALASLRAEAEATIQGIPGVRIPSRPIEVSVVFVPMLLTLGFLWLAARAGRRAAEERPGGNVAVTAAVAAAGAAIPAAALAALAAVLVSLSFPGIGLRTHVDVGSAAVWAGLLSAAGAGAGAWLHAARGRRSAAVLRGGLAGYAWALALLAVGAVFVSALEPAVTGAYVDGLRGLGEGGGVLFGVHLLALPTQSALLLAPASGSCLQLIGDGPVLDLCPWNLVPSGAAAFFLTDPVPLSPWLWLLNGAPPIAAALAGGAAAREARAGRPVLVGTLAGAVFASVAIVGAWFAAPRISGVLPLLVVPVVAIRIDPVSMGATCLLWGLAGGAVGGWLEGRR